MNSYKYELKVYVPAGEGLSKRVKRFIGNDENTLAERFEMWVIKSGYDRNELQTRIDEIQHAGY